MNWYFKVILKHYADFKGRASRKEYWMFTLFGIVFYLLFLILISILGNLFQNENSYPIIGFLAILFPLMLLLPSMAVTVRRLHDINKSGWMILISLIPIIGSIWLVVLLVTDSSIGKNKYDENQVVKQEEKLVYNILSENESVELAHKQQISYREDGIVAVKFKNEQNEIMLVKATVNCHHCNNPINCELTVVGVGGPELECKKCNQVVQTFSITKTVSNEDFLFVEFSPLYGTINYKLNPQITEITTMEN